MEHLSYHAAYEKPIHRTRPYRTDPSSMFPARTISRVFRLTIGSTAASAAGPHEDFNRCTAIAGVVNGLSANSSFNRQTSSSRISYATAASLPDEGHSHRSRLCFGVLLFFLTLIGCESLKNVDSYTSDTKATEIPAVQHPATTLGIASPRHANDATKSSFIAIPPSKPPGCC